MPRLTRGEKSVEIERRYLLRTPPSAEFLSRCTVEHITQLYVENTPGFPRRSRLRRSTREGVTSFTWTAKRHLSALSREETTLTISEAQYTFLRRWAVRHQAPQNKMRYRFTQGAHTFELDHVTFPVARWVLEVELSSEGDTVTLPPLDVDREITFEKHRSPRH